MRVAALYDIHGNIAALEAVLEDVRESVRYVLHPPSEAESLALFALGELQ